MYVIEGLDNVEGVAPGSFALVLKTHHAAIDGVSGMELLSAIHDPAPDASPPQPIKEWKPEDEPPAWQLLARANVNNFMRPMHFARVLGRTVPGLGRVQRELRNQRARGVSLPAVRRTRFNGTVSPHRVVDGLRVPLEEMRRIKTTVPGATVNDVALTIVGGALRAYLNDKAELPADPLVAMCPISVRTEEEKGMAGNKVSAMFTSLATDVADAGERLVAVREATHASKELTNAIDARTLSEYSQFVPGALAGLGARLSSDLSLANRTNPPYNVVVSNVPGPQKPLYFTGAQMETQFGFGMVHNGMGLMHGVMSYCGDMMLCITSDRDMMPDPAFYTDCLKQSFQELSTATR
jgi:WS/DGAT/MGAT family acyltransferase